MKNVEWLPYYVSFDGKARSLQNRTNSAQSSMVSGENFGRSLQIPLIS